MKTNTKNNIILSSGIVGLSLLCCIPLTISASHDEGNKPENLKSKAPIVERTSTVKFEWLKTPTPKPTKKPTEKPKEDPIIVTDEDDEEYAYYRNCTDARRAGAAPIRRGEPGYRRALDRDNDGIACD